MSRFPPCILKRFREISTSQDEQHTEKERHKASHFDTAWCARCRDNCKLDHLHV
jgi:hypothetical protein